MYKLIDLGNGPDGGELVPVAINNLGQVVGSYFNPTTGLGRGFVWHNGVATELQPIGGVGNCWATSINDNGVIVGGWDPGSGIPNACLWDRGKAINISENTDVESVAMGINNRGHIAGIANSQAFLLDGHGIYNYVPLINGTDPMFAYGLNNNDVLFGFHNSPMQTACIWDLQNGARDLFPKDVFDLTVSLGINNSGVAVGLVIFDPAMTLESAYKWTDGAWEFLTPGKNHGRASGINSNGDIIFSETDPVTYENLSYLWSNGTVTRLNDLVYKSLGWELSNPAAINDLGQIIGFGTFFGASEGWLISPVRTGHIIQDLPMLPLLPLINEIIFGFDVEDKQRYGSKDNNAGKTHRQNPMLNGLSANMRDVLIEIAINKLAGQIQDPKISRQLQDISLGAAIQKFKDHMKD
jgi:probable HAF family extracellular repeat protein